MLYPDIYRAFCLKHTGKVINHDDSIPDSKLEDYAKQTNRAWYNENIPYGIDDVEVDETMPTLVKARKKIQEATFGPPAKFEPDYCHGTYLLPEETKETM